MLYVNVDTYGTSVSFFVFTTGSDLDKLLPVSGSVKLVALGNLLS